MLTGAACIDDLQTIKSEVTQVIQNHFLNLNPAGLSKWFSYSPGVTACESTIKQITISDLYTTKALSTIYCGQLKKRNEVDTSVIGLRATKWNRLSEASKLFDAIGLLCPIVIRGKILLQKLWP